MTLIEIFRQKEGMRLTWGCRWMVWDSTDKGWIIYENKKYQKRIKIILETVSERDAVDCLLDQ